MNLCTAALDFLRLPKTYFELDLNINNFKCGYLAKEGV